jgi:TPR repeat protein
VAPARRRHGVPAAGVLLAAALFATVAAPPAQARDEIWYELPWDVRTGPEWYRVKATLGDPEAQYRLGLLYENGVKLERNFARAADWYRRAGRQGHPRAQFKLGALHQAGALGTVDLAAAGDWYAKAARQGLAQAEYNLAVLIERGLGRAPDPARAAELYRKAAADGILEAQMSLGLLYARGEGVGRDPVEAVARLTLAAEAAVPGASQARERVVQELSAEQRAAAWARVRALRGAES